MQPPEELVPGLAWSGNTTLLWAREKQGKSTYVSFCAASLTRVEGEKRVVLWVNLEESLGHIGRRFKLFGANPDLLYVAGDLEKQDDDLEALIGKYQPSLVVIDSLSAWLTKNNDDLNSAGKMTPVMRKLSSVARKTDVAIVLIHHATKSTGTARDSSAITATVDMSVAMVTNSTDHHIRDFRPNGRWSVDPYSMRFTGQSFEPVGVLPELLDRVRLFIEQNPECSKRAILKEVTGGNPSKAGAIDQLLDQGQIINRGDGSCSKFVVPSKGFDDLVADTTRHTRGTLRDTQEKTSQARDGHGRGTVRGTPPCPTP